MAMDPIVIDPPAMDVAAEWQECREYVDRCGGIVHPDGEPNWRAAFGADPGICSCPACGEDFWAFGHRQRCAKCGFEYPTDAWSMYSWGAQAARKVWSKKEHERRMEHPYYRYGFEHPPADGVDLFEEFRRIDWRSVFPGGAK